MIRAFAMPAFGY